MSTSRFDSRLPCRVELVGSPVLPYPQVHLRQLPPPAGTSCPVPARASRSQYRAPVFRDENVLLVANMITTDCALAGHLGAIRPGPSMRSTPSSPLQVERSSVAASRVPSCPWHAQPSSGPQVVSHTVAAACVRASAHQAPRVRRRTDAIQATCMCELLLHGIVPMACSSHRERCICGGPTAAEAVETSCPHL